MHQDGPWFTLLTTRSAQAFLDEAERHGKDIPVSFSDGRHSDRTIVTEARILKRMFLRLRD